MTPGPWKVADDHPSKACAYVYAGAREHEVAVAFNLQSGSYLEDATAIAAVPDLIEACNKAEQWIADADTFSDADNLAKITIVLGALRAALLKAGARP